MSFNKSNLIFSIIACIISHVTIIVCCRNGVLLKTGVTSEERTALLDEHNRLRQLVALGRVTGQPGAENMQEMQWDDELAETAQKWANQCTFEHDPVKYLGRFGIGQNLAIIWSTAPLPEDEGTFVSRVKKWFNEVYKYAFGSPWSLQTGHYTQLVWSDTNLMGCGFAYYQTYSKYNKLYVCNYGPNGNINGVSPYEAGSPSCEHHGLIPSSRYDGLCSTSTLNNQYQYNDYTNSYYTYNTYDNSAGQAQYDTQYAYVPVSNQPQPNQNQYSYPTKVKQATPKPDSSDNYAYKNYRWDLLFKNAFNAKGR